MWDVWDLTGIICMFEDSRSPPARMSSAAHIVACKQGHIPPKSQTVRHLITYFSAFINSLSV